MRTRHSTGDVSGRSLLSREEVQRELLSLLVRFDEFCREHSLRYSLDFGTLLGAVRHGGFIPWDDDIDLSMPRPDLERLIDLAGELGDGLELFTLENAPLSFAFPKFANTSIRAQESYYEGHMDEYLWIDIFPFDGVPCDDRGLRREWARAKRVQRRLIWSSLPDVGSLPKRAVKHVIAFQTRNRDVRAETASALSETLNTDRYNSSTRVAPLLCLQKRPWSLPRDAYETTVEVEFEGRKFPAMSCWREELRGAYGDDYMTPPPVGERQAHEPLVWRVGDGGSPGDARDVDSDGSGDGCSTTDSDARADAPGDVRSVALQPTGDPQSERPMRRVITYGTFDLLHYGHINLLRRAREMGDYLVVGLSTDEFNWHEKHKKCYFSFEERRSLLEAIRYVDCVIAEESWEQKARDVAELGIDVFVIGEDWAGKFDFLSDCGCEVVYLPRTPEISTTQIKRDLRDSPPPRHSEPTGGNSRLGAPLPGAPPQPVALPSPVAGIPFCSLDCAALAWGSPPPVAEIPLCSSGRAALAWGSPPPVAEIPLCSLDRRKRGPTNEMGFLPQVSGEMEFPPRVSGEMEFPPQVSGEMGFPPHERGSAMPLALRALPGARAA